MSMKAVLVRRRVLTSSLPLKSSLSTRTASSLAALNKDYTSSQDSSSSCSSTWSTTLAAAAAVAGGSVLLNNNHAQHRSAAAACEEQSQSSQPQSPPTLQEQEAEQYYGKNPRHDPFYRHVTKGGIKDPMTKYQKIAILRELREEQKLAASSSIQATSPAYYAHASSRVRMAPGESSEEMKNQFQRTVSGGGLRDPMTTFQQRAIDRALLLAQEQEELEQQVLMDDDDNNSSSSSSSNHSPAHAQEVQATSPVLVHVAAPKDSSLQERINTKSGIKDPMTLYQQRVEEDEEVDGLRDPMTIYQKRANRRILLEQEQEEEEEEEEASSIPTPPPVYIQATSAATTTPPPTQVSNLKRLFTKSGIKDPMTSYQRQADERALREELELDDKVLPVTVQATSSSSTNDAAKIRSKKSFQRAVTKAGLTDPMTLYQQNAILSAIEADRLEHGGEEEEQEEQTHHAVQATSSKAKEGTNGKPRSYPTEMTAAEARLEENARKAKQHSGALKLFSGNGNMSLAMEITRQLGISLGKATVGRFADGEVNVVIHENVRGKDCYVVQPTCMPVNDNLMELLLMVSTLRRASARRITVVIPYYGYARQDRKMQARVPISAADVARLMESMGVDRVIAVDLHCGQIQGFFGPRVPVDNLDGGIVGLDYFGCKDLHKPVIVSPDAGGVYRAKKFKEGLEQKYDMKDLGLAMIVKQRARAGSVDQMDLVGDVKDCDCVIVDDMIDTAGTLCKAAEVLVANGARRVFAFASHGLLSGPGNDRLANSKMEEVVILNTIPSTPQREANEKLSELSVAPLLAQAIFNIHAKKSISALFK